MRDAKSLRDNRWLLTRLNYLWDNYFSDIEQVNPLFVRFGKYSKYRLGSIKMDRKSDKSYVTITGMFKMDTIPVEVVDHTLAHELVHYAHGFSSKRTRLHKYPHAGGVVKKEMIKRGMGNLVKSYKLWVKEYKQSLQKLRFYKQSLRFRT